MIMTIKSLIYHNGISIGNGSLITSVIVYSIGLTIIPFVKVLLKKVLKTRTKDKCISALSAPGNIEEKKGIFEFKQYDDEYGTIFIKLAEDKHLFAIITFSDKEANLRMAEKFIKYFEGNEVDFSEDIGLCEQ